MVAHASLLLACWVIIPRVTPIVIYLGWPLWGILLALWYAWPVILYRTHGKKEGVGVCILGTLFAIPSTAYVAGAASAFIHHFNHG